MTYEEAKESEGWQKSYGPIVRLPRLTMAERLVQWAEDDKNKCLAYGKWLIENCVIIKEGFNYKGPISNEEAYELYLESLKDVK